MTARYRKERGEIAIPIVNRSWALHFKGTNFAKFNSQLLAGAKARGVVGYLKGTITKPSGPIPYVATAATPWYSQSPSDGGMEYARWVHPVDDHQHVRNPIGYGIKDEMDRSRRRTRPLTSVFDVKSDLGLVSAV
ncbi:hypothetical protein B0H14DRAFT_3521868 [Mycena olivaceomarginata]|nr:hypothetical protein B0H14DRAFT_3521868 [Mycena olivaceomarginata]